jgi:hypothetical protein
MMTFASDNAGAGRARQLRREAQEGELDPNLPLIARSAVGPASLPAGVARCLYFDGDHS